MDLLRQKCELGVQIGGMDTRHGLERFAEFETGMQQWLLHLYQYLPGELRPCGRWMREAELWFQRVDANWCSETATSQEQKQPYVIPADSDVVSTLVKERNVSFDLFFVILICKQLSSFFPSVIIWSINDLMHDKIRMLVLYFHDCL